MKKKTETNHGTIITRNNPDLNFGQTVTIVNQVKSNGLLLLYVIPDGERKTYEVPYNECWPSDQYWDYENLENQLSANGVWDHPKNRTVSTS